MAYSNRSQYHNRTFTLLSTGLLLVLLDGFLHGSTYAVIVLKNRIPVATRLMNTPITIVMYLVVCSITIVGLLFFLRLYLARKTVSSYVSSNEHPLRVTIDASSRWMKLCRIFKAIVYAVAAVSSELAVLAIINMLA